MFLLVTDRTVWVRNGPIDTTSGSDSGSSDYASDTERGAGLPHAAAASGMAAISGGGSNSAARNGSPAAENRSSAAAAAAPAAADVNGGATAAATAAAAPAATAQAAKRPAARLPNVCLTWFIADELEDWLGLQFDGSRWSFAQDCEDSFHTRSE